MVSSLPAVPRPPCSPPPSGTTGSKQEPWLPGLAVPVGMWSQLTVTVSRLLLQSEARGLMSSQGQAGRGGHWFLAESRSPGFQSSALRSREPPPSWVLSMRSGSSQGGHPRPSPWARLQLCFLPASSAFQAVILLGNSCLRLSPGSLPPSQDLHALEQICPQHLSAEWSSHRSLPWVWK